MMSHVTSTATTTATNFRRVVTHSFGEGQGIEFFLLNAAEKQPFLVFGFLQMLAVGVQRSAVGELEREHKGYSRGKKQGGRSEET